MPAGADAASAMQVRAMAARIDSQAQMATKQRTSTRAQVRSNPTPDPIRSRPVLEADDRSSSNSSTASTASYPEPIPAAPLPSEDLKYLVQYLILNDQDQPITTHPGVLVISATFAHYTSQTTLPVKISLAVIDTVVIRKPSENQSILVIHCRDLRRAGFIINRELRDDPEAHPSFLAPVKPRGVSTSSSSSHSLSHSPGSSPRSGKDGYDDRSFDPKEIQKILIHRREELKNVKVSGYDPALHKAFHYEAESELFFLGAPENKEWKPLTLQAGRRFLVPHSFDTSYPFRIMALTSTWPRFPVLSYRCWNPSHPADGAVLLRSGRPTSHMTVASEHDKADRIGREREYVDDLSISISAYARRPVAFPVLPLISEDEKEKEDVPLIVFDTGAKDAALAEAYRYACQYSFGVLPPFKEIKEAYDKMAALALPFIINYLDWKRMVDESPWRKVVEKTMSAAYRIVATLLSGRDVLIEHGGAAWAEEDAVLAALVQVILEPKYRTVQGLARLVQKEFVVGSSEGGLGSPEGHVALFLFFNCVFDLIVARPEQFEFTREFLPELFTQVYSSLVVKLGIKALPNLAVDVFQRREQCLNPTYSPTDQPHVIPREQNSLRGEVWIDFLMYNNPSVNDRLFKVMQKVALLPAGTTSAVVTQAPSVPASVFALPLTSLSVNGGYLRDLPSAFLVTAPYLKELSLDGNWVSTISPHLARCVSLTKLSLARNSIRRFPAILIPSLESLSLEANQLVDVENIALLTSLKSLNLSWNALSRLPVSMARLTGLTYLSLAHNKLTHVPTVTIHSLTALQVFDLGYNEIAILSDGFRGLNSLVDLYLGHNKLKELPPTIFTCTSLTQLNATDNQLTEVHFTIGELRSLEILNLNTNLIKTLPNTLVGCASLVRLFMRNNRLTEVPLWFYRFQRLQRIDFQKNRIRKVSSGISHMDSLRSLDLSANLITQLPLPLGCLSETLGEILLEGNEIANVPSEYLSKGTHALLEYLYRTLNESQTIFRMKLMVVGNENVGKTSIISLLKKKWESETPVVTTVPTATPAQAPTKSGDRNQSTDGIDISTSYFYTSLDDAMPTLGGQRATFLERSTTMLEKSVSRRLALGRVNKKKAKQRITINIWDFAGQQVYYATHSFFLSEWSIYLLVFNLVESEKNTDMYIDYWLQSIRSRVKNPTVIIVGTHLDDKAQTKTASERIDKIQATISQRYPNVTLQAIAVSCTKEMNVNELRGLVQNAVTSSPVLGTKMPFSYFFFESLLQEFASDLETPVITQSELLRIGGVCGLNTLKEVLEATRVLHEAGSIIYFEKITSLKDLVILNPQWLFEVLATVFTTKHQWIKKGILDESSLAQIWKQYPHQIHPQLIQLLTKFEVAHELKGDVNLQQILDVLAQGTKTPADVLRPSTSATSLLVAAMLPSQRPELVISSFIREARDPSVKLERFYSFDFIPAGLFARLLSRIMASTKTLLGIWSHGIVTETASQGSSAGLFFEQFSASVSSNLKLTEIQRSALYPNMICLMVRGKNVRDVRNVFSYAADILFELFGELRQVSVRQFVADPKSDGILVDVEMIEATLSESKVDPSQWPKLFDFDLHSVVPDLIFSNFEGPRVALTSLNVTRELGQGGFATVLKGSFQGQDVAVKKITIPTDLRRFDSARLRSNLRNELLMQSSLNHPNIGRVLAVCLSPMAIVTELCPFGSLHSLLHEKADRHLSWKFRLQCALDVAEGLAYMHGRSPPMAHLDLKPHNILMRALDYATPGSPERPAESKGSESKRATWTGDGPAPSRSNLNLSPPAHPVVPQAPDSSPTAGDKVEDRRGPPFCQIIDFGTSRMIPSSEPLTVRYVDNPVFLAPEILQGKPYDHTVDTYGFGIVLWELVSRTPYFGEITWMSDLQDRVLAGERPPMPAHMPDALKELIEKCWHAESLARPPMERLVVRLKALQAQAEEWERVYPLPKEKKEKRKNRKSIKVDRDVIGTDPAYPEGPPKSTRQRSGRGLRSLLNGEGGSDDESSDEEKNVRTKEKKDEEERVEKTDEKEKEKERGTRSPDFTPPPSPHSSPIITKLLSLPSVPFTSSSSSLPQGANSSPTRKNPDTIAVVWVEENENDDTRALCESLKSSLPNTEFVFPIGHMLVHRWLLPILREFPLEKIRIVSSSAPNLVEHLVKKRNMQKAWKEIPIMVFTHEASQFKSFATKTSVQITEKKQELISYCKK